VALQRLELARLAPATTRGQLEVLYQRGSYLAPFFFSSFFVSGGFLGMAEEDGLSFSAAGAARSLAARRWGCLLPSPSFFFFPSSFSFSTEVRRILDISASTEATSFFHRERHLGKVAVVSKPLFPTQSLPFLPLSPPTSAWRLVISRPEVARASRTVEDLLDSSTRLPPLQLRGRRFLLSFLFFFIFLPSPAPSGTIRPVSSAEEPPGKHLTELRGGSNDTSASFPLLAFFSIFPRSMAGGRRFELSHV